MNLIYKMKKKTNKKYKGIKLKYEVFHLCERSEQYECKLEL